MPAINLARLRSQTAQLSEDFEDPKAFIHALHDLLDLYAERTHRPGQSGTPPPLIKSYSVPKPVLRQIALGITPLVKSKSSKALALCDALWEVPYLEFRLLAVSILGLIPPEPPDIVFSRIDKWGPSITEDQILAALMQQGLTSIRQESSKLLVVLIDDWLSSSETISQKMGLHALSPLLSDSNFENLPVFYRLLTPFVRNVSSQIRPYVLDVLKALARRSPQETAYFLHQNLEVPDNPDTAWLIRHSLHEFPITNQDRLREAIRNIE